MNTTERKPTGRKLLESRRIAQAKAIAQAAAEAFGLSVADLQRSKRDASHSEARAIAGYLMMEDVGITTTDAAAAFRREGHAAAIRWRHTVDREIKRCTFFAMKVAAIRGRAEAILKREGGSHE